MRPTARSQTNRVTNLQKLSYLVCAALGHNPDPGMQVCIMPDYLTPQPIPNYAGNLDAMHAAVMTLNDNQRRTFANYLVGVICGLAQRDSTDDFYVLNAAPQYRAKALLMTLGQWKSEYAELIS